jgi:hypothetical protein
LLPQKGIIYPSDTASYPINKIILSSDHPHTEDDGRGRPFSAKIAENSFNIVKHYNIPTMNPPGRPGQSFDGSITVNPVSTYNRSVEVSKMHSMSNIFCLHVLTSEEPVNLTTDKRFTPSTGNKQSVERFSPKDICKMDLIPVNKAPDMDCIIEKFPYANPVDVSIDAQRVVESALIAHGSVSMVAIYLP